jgi:hypothetical protein
MKISNSTSILPLFFLLFFNSVWSQAPVAGDDNAQFIIPECNSNVFLYLNDTGVNGIDYNTYDLDVNTPGIQSTINLLQGTLQVTNGNLQFFPFQSEFIIDPVSINYTFQDNLGVTSNVAVITISFINFFPEFQSTQTTCDNPNSGSIELFYLAPANPNDYQFDLYKNGVFYNTYLANGTPDLLIEGLSVGTYTVQNFVLNCGIVVTTNTTAISIGVENPLTGYVEGNYDDYNNDGIVNVGDVINQQYIVTNLSSCTINDVSLNLYSQPELINFTGQPIVTFGPNATDSSSLTTTRVISQEDINQGFVRTFVGLNCVINGTPVSNLTIIGNEPLNLTNRIKMNAFIDTNNNGIKESNEENFDRGNFIYSINGGEEHVINAFSGVFYLYESNPLNVYNLQFDINPNNVYCDGQSTVATSSYSNVTVSAGSGMTTYNFAITVVPCSDVEVFVLPTNNPRPGFINQNKIVIRNIGNQPISTGTVTFIKDNAVAITSVSPAATTSNSSGFTYNFSNLLPNQVRNIVVDMQIPTIPTVSLGQLITNSATVVLAISESNLLNNNTNLTSTIVGSYDPNEKSESHGGKILYSSFTADDYLTYTILFENTGTAEAINVRVEDLLEVKLDETTVRMIRASSNYVLDKVGSNLTWRFEGINLPPSNGSATIGHGEITFQVKPKTGYAIGDVISNTANIYFDFNPPITTDPCLTEFVAVLGNENFAFSSLQFFPNPVINRLSIKNQSIIDEIAVTSVLGQNMMIQKVDDIQSELDLSALKRGVYFVKITSKGTQKTFKVLKE